MNSGDHVHTCLIDFGNSWASFGTLSDPKVRQIKFSDTI